MTEKADVLFSNSAKEKLNEAITRIERLEEEKAGVATDIKELYAELKALGFDTKIVRLVVKRRRANKQELAEMEELLRLYEDSIDIS